MEQISKESLAKVDEAALKFYETKSKKEFEHFVKCANPLLRSFSNRTCCGSKWDKDDLFSILLADMWRLLNAWQPDPKYKFHYLMLRQLKNQSINFVNWETRAYVSCRVCGHRNPKKSKECEKCNTCLMANDTFIVYENIEQGGFDHKYYEDPEALDNVINKDIVCKLINSISDITVKRVVVLYLRGNTKSEIEHKLKLPVGTVNRCFYKCRTILKKLDKKERSTTIK